VYAISIVTYGARRLCSEEEKNEISIDDYLLNNTLLSFLPRSFSVSVCVSVSYASTRVGVRVVVVDDARDSMMLVLVMV
jgi:hypothetical protein